jgi:flagellar motor switch protein FliN
LKTYFDCWVQVASALLSQAVAGEPELIESLPSPLNEGAFAFAATLAGEVEGQFSILLDGSLRDATLMGEGADQKPAWSELLRETVDAAAGELLASAGKKCQVTKFDEIPAQGQVSRAFHLRSGEKKWTILVRDDVRPAESKSRQEPDRKDSASSGATLLSPGLELLLDVELETSLRFGSREMPLGEILDLGPGDVVELDRHVADPVDLIVGDKIVARGEVVLVNGNFGLRVTEVAAPRKRLESIRCLF